MSGDLGATLAALAGNPLAQGTAAALATFVLEDAAAIACAALVAGGMMTASTAFLGLAIGIIVGDVGLYVLGRGAASAVVARGWLDAARLDGIAQRFRRGVVPALLASRFVPGTRLPTYLAAGALRVPVTRFVAIVVIASVAWIGLVVGLADRLGETAVAALDTARLNVAFVIVAGAVALHAGLALRSREPGRPRVASRFEFWPAWLFYAPVAAWYALLALRHRSLLLPSAANPSIYAGGLIGEAKSDVLALVTGDARRFVARWTVIERARGASPADLLASARAAMDAASLALPVVAKPDLGMRGAGVRPCRTEAELAEHLAAFPTGARVMLQQLVGSETAGAGAALPDRLRGVREGGVLWARDPDTGLGRIVSLTLKRFPEVTGDGRSSLADLIDADPRARLLRRVHRERHAGRLGWIPGPGERVPLVFAGNHCRGAIFLDGTDLATPALLAAIDRIARSMRGFEFGRLDVRFDCPEAFLRGEDLRIVEINGAGAEATHVWDPAARLLPSWAALCAQWSLLFRIGAAQRRRGARTIPPGSFLRDVLAYRRLARALPVTR